MSYFNKLRVRQKYGKDAKFLTWPKGFGWMPNLNHETFIHNGYFLYRGRAGQQTVALPEMSLHNLFFLVYDRGVHRQYDPSPQRQQFFEFWRLLYRKYGFRVLKIADWRNSNSLPVVRGNTLR